MKINTLQRGLKSRHLTFIALGGIIGSSYFLGTGYLIKEIGPGAFIAYILGGIISYITLACLAELAINSPTHGSFIHYASKFVSPAWGCGVGWSYWINWIVYIPSECIAAGIIVNSYIPSIHEYLWAAIFAAVISIINIIKVHVFGESEFWLSLIKITLLLGFSILALLIFFGAITGSYKEAIGTRFLLQQGGLFPSGFFIVFINMVVLLSNYQGSEIIGISAAESHAPHINIPKALRTISIRILFLYIIPTFLVGLIMPWQQAGLKGSIFAQALERYGLIKIGHIFNFLILAGALSCANSGLYASVRSLYALAKSGMAPASFSHLNRHGIPYKATITTLGCLWGVLFLAYFFSSSAVYANLLAMSGFTGSICWISICWCQLLFRRSKNKEKLKYQAPLFPWLSHLGIWLQVSCLAIVALSSNLRAAFYFGIPVVLIPMLAHKLWKKNQRHS